MKLVCSQRNLRAGLETIGKILRTCPFNIPVLDNVKLVAGKTGLELWATDLSITIRYGLVAQVEEAGAITAPRRGLRQVASALLGEYVQMETGPSAILAIRCAGTRTSIIGITAEDFPIMPEVPERSAVELDAAEMSRLIMQTVFAASTRQKDVILSGVLLEFSGNELKMVASDGFRLSASSLEFSERIQEPKSIIVPAWVLKELGRLVSKAKGRVSVFVDEKLSQVFFRFGEILFVSRLIEGTFIDYRNCIPRQEQRTVAVVSTANFLKAMETIQVLARNAARYECSGVVRKQANIVHLRIAPAGEEGFGSIGVSAMTEVAGSIGARLEARVEGEGVEIAFNGRYLSQALSAIEAERVEFSTTSPTGAVLIKPVGDKNFLHVLMPMGIPN